MLEERHPPLSSGAVVFTCPPSLSIPLSHSLFSLFWLQNLAQTNLQQPSPCADFPTVPLVVSSVSWKRSECDVSKCLRSYLNPDESIILVTFHWRHPLNPLFAVTPRENTGDASENEEGSWWTLLFVLLTQDRAWLLVGALQLPCNSLQSGLRRVLSHVKRESKL